MAGKELVFRHLHSLFSPYPRSRLPSGHLVAGNPRLRASDGRASVHQTRYIGAGLPGDIEGNARRQLPLRHQLLRVGDHPPVLSSFRFSATVSGPSEALHVVLSTRLGPTV